MRQSELFKYLALAGAGAYAYCFFKENPHLFGLTKSNEEKANELIDKLQSYNMLNQNLAGAARDVVSFGHKRHYQNNVIDVTPK